MDAGTGPGGDRQQGVSLYYWHFADGCIYEILEILKGEESQLALLASKERYENITGQVRRIVIIERMEQIEGLKRYQIHGIAGYVTVDVDGKTCYQHP